MKFKAFQRTILAAGLMGGLAATALPQIPVPPLPGLNVRITTGRPPAVQYERRSAQPGPDYAWVGGFWDWDGARWRWISGRWERRAEPQAYWITPRYVRSGRAYIYEPGHWSHQTIVVGDDLRGRPEWRRHEREHEKELQRERDRNRGHDRDHDRDRDRQ